MLSSLSIKNIALIEELNLRLGKGLNILSGETGAGKSIIIDSLNFVLGERADKTLIRNGADKAIVEAVFDNYLNKDIENILVSYGIDVEDVLIIRRTMTENKNECRVNGNQVTLSMLKTISEKLVDILGQHEHQSLLKTENHIVLLDSFGTNEITQAKLKCEKCYTDYSGYKKEFKRYGNSNDRERRLDILSYQINELKEASLIDGEEEQLLIDRKKYRNSEKILNALIDAEELINGGKEGYSVISAINKAINLLNIASSFDEGLLVFVDRFESNKIELKDLSEELRKTSDSFNFDEFNADKIEKRLEKVRTLSRKYGGNVSSALLFLSEAESEYETLVNADEICNKLVKQIENSGKDLLKSCAFLHDLREKTAKLFETEINNHLKELGMPSAIFKVRFENVVGKCADDCSANGYDKIEFLISANKGEPLKPLAKIISGGEMSRFMLALKNITSRLDGISTMVFDEIDTGISGTIAGVVAEKLYNISTDRQVIAVTHLPQLASMADLHYKIEKFETRDKTVTSITLLNKNGELDEIARLIGGSSYSEHALPHAMIMKAHADEYKSSK